MPVIAAMSSAGTTTVLVMASEDKTAEQLPAEFTRSWWRALVENHVALLEDAALLLGHDRPARASSLHVLAMEELAKAVRLYDAAQQAWTSGAAVLDLEADFEKRATHHLSKLMRALEYDAGLEMFWGDYSAIEPPEDLSADGILATLEGFYASLHQRAGGLNDRKKGGFYVDRHGTEVRTPADVPADGIEAAICRTAQVGMMLLIRDHSRMKSKTPDRYDSTHALQGRLMALGYPDEVAEARDAGRLE